MTAIGHGSVWGWARENPGTHISESVLHGVGDGASRGTPIGCKRAWWAMFWPPIHASCCTFSLYFWFHEYALRGTGDGAYRGVSVSLYLSLHRLGYTARVLGGVRLANTRFLLPFFNILYTNRAL